MTPKSRPDVPAWLDDPTLAITPAEYRAMVAELAAREAAERPTRKPDVPRTAKKEKR